MKIPVLLILCLSLSGCVTVPQSPSLLQMDTADYGNYPNDYQKIVKKFMETRLFDPYSAVYSNWTKPVRKWVRRSSGFIFGYRVDVHINAKNRMGGYVGAEPMTFLINNGEVIHYQKIYR
jgi:hypothetical protein